MEILLSYLWVVDALCGAVRYAKICLLRQDSASPLLWTVSWELKMIICRYGFENFLDEPETLILKDHLEKYINSLSCRELCEIYVTLIS